MGIEAATNRLEGRLRPGLGVLTLALVALLGALACDVAEHSERLRRYEATGTVEAVDVGAGHVMIAHEDIPGLMPAMTMSFDAPESVLAKLAVGQQITFTLELRDTQFRVVEAEVLSGPAAGAVAGSSGIASVPVAEPAPPFTLIDPNGDAVSLSDLKGRVVLLDFIYTHCPGPCPILTATHVSVQRKLPEELRERVHLVSISLDPERDTPERMGAYGEERGADLAHWSFLTGDAASIDAVLAAYQVGSTPAKDGEISHLVITYLIDPEGRVAKRFLGTEHSAEEIVAEIAQVAG
jgi:protein SCO1/2